MKLNSKKSALILCLVVAMVFIVAKPYASSKIQAYYSGEAISYNNSVVIGTVNTGAMELFTMEGEELVRTASFNPKFTQLPRGLDKYMDLEFVEEGSKLYLYLTNGVYLYKYDVSNPYSPKLLSKQRDGGWDWFYQIEQIDDYLVTIGNKNIKLWNTDIMDVVKTYDVVYDKTRPNQVIVSDEGDYIFSIVDDKIHIYDTDKREVIKSIAFTVKDKNSNRSLYFDSAREEIYMADDIALKVFDMDGRELRRFNHKSDRGYDVRPASFGSSVYFSDGLGIVKSNMLDLEAQDWVYTTGIGSAKNTWAMDIEVVSSYKGDSIVVFNNNEILVLDKNLDMVDYFVATETTTYPVEDLSLKLDKNHAFPGDAIMVSGTGFELNEEIKISLKNKKWTAKADERGRFVTTIQIDDELKPQKADIKADGLASGLTYSISFKID